MPKLPQSYENIEHSDKIEPIVSYLSSYIQTCQNQTYHSREPALLLGQYVNKPNVRRNNVPYMLGGLLWLTGIAGPAYDLPASPKPPRVETDLSEALRIFNLLEPYRQGPEATIVGEAYRTIGEKYGTKHDRRVEIGRLAIAGFRVNYPESVQTAREAVLALQLDALLTEPTPPLLQATPTEPINITKSIPNKVL